MELWRTRPENGNLTYLLERWNVRTLFKPGAAQCLVKEIRRYNLGVVALQKQLPKDWGTALICRFTKKETRKYAVTTEVLPY